MADPEGSGLQDRESRSPSKAPLLQPKPDPEAEEQRNIAALLSQPTEPQEEEQKPALISPGLPVLGEYDEDEKLFKPAMELRYKGPSGLRPLVVAQPCLTLQPPLFPGFSIYGKSLCLIIEP